MRLSFKKESLRCNFICVPNSRRMRMQLARDAFWLKRRTWVFPQTLTNFSLPPLPRERESLLRSRFRVAVLLSRTVEVWLRTRNQEIPLWLFVRVRSRESFTLLFSLLARKKKQGCCNSARYLISSARFERSVYQLTINNNKKKTNKQTNNSDSNALSAIYTCCMSFVCNLGEISDDCGTRAHVHVSVFKRETKWEFVVYLSVRNNATVIRRRVSSVNDFFFRRKTITARRRLQRDDEIMRK